ncbi:hypothetical protein L5515_018512 [Caenorhabditis briggsae]|uniref:Uncharacterized protein n=1 Tax=Caenorhabditis briggsae TaxID=6238 RepID=A0AAE9JSD4_CAEBR|nr:hypothetical protein L5515_018512 [Caenorhabditis briggsae]
MYSHKFFSIPLTVAKTALSATKFAMKYRRKIHIMHCLKILGSSAYNCIMKNEWGFFRKNLVLTFEKWTNLLVEPGSVSPDDREAVIYSDDDGEFWKIFKIIDMNIFGNYSEDVIDYNEDDENND